MDPGSQKCERGDEFWTQAATSVRVLANFVDPGCQKCEKGGKFWTHAAAHVRGVANFGPRLPDV